MSFYKNPMRGMAMALAAGVALAFGGAGQVIQPTHTVHGQMTPRPTKRAMLARRGFYTLPRHRKSKTRTGGGGRVARRVWKKRRASGRA